MSEPRHGHSLQHALSEIISAESALNMEPEPMEEPTGQYLSETDQWAAHAMEHLHAAFDTINKAPIACRRRMERLLREYLPLVAAGKIHLGRLVDMLIHTVMYEE